LTQKWSIKLKLVLQIVLITVFFSACQQTFTDLDQYKKYVQGEDYPYLQTIEKNGVKVELRYLPVDILLTSSYASYMKKKETLTGDKTKPELQHQEKLGKLWEDIKKRREGFDQSIYFQLKIGYVDNKDIVYESMGQGFQSYSEWLQKLLFNLTEYIDLKTALMEEVPLIDYHFERSFGMTKYRTIMLVFPKTFNDVDLLKKEKEQLTIRLKEFGLKTGILKFTFDLPLTKTQFDYNRLR
jgi:hypothetical protein